MERSVDLFERIRQHMPGMTRSYLKVAQFLLDRHRDAAFLTAAQVAAECEVSESLVVRFAGALGYSGYPELARELQTLVKASLSLPERFSHRPVRLTAETPASELMQAVVSMDQENLEQTLRDASSSSFEKVIGAMVRARTIYCLGLRGPSHLAALLGILLDKAGADVRVITSGDVVMFDQLRHIGPEDMLIAISFARYTKRTVEAVQLAGKRGATTVLLTDSLLAPAVTESDYSLHAKVASYSFHNSYTAAMSIINALVVAWTVRAERRTLASLEGLEEVLPHEDFI